MISTDTRNERTAPQQLTLLTESMTSKELTVSNAPVQFRLSKTTRERGLSHVAEIRRQLAEAQARQAESQAPTLPPRHSQAA